MLRIFLLISILSSLAQAKVVGKDVEYKDGSTTLQGYFAYNDEKLGKLPGVIVVHNWLGLSEHTKERVNQLAELGYAAFAADIYGKGVRPKDANEAGKMAGQYKGDIKTYRSRMKAAYDTLKKQSNVHPGKIAAMGYCFGGTGALELARSGIPVSGVVTFHGALSTPSPQDAKNIKGKVLVLHGADDPFVKPEEVAAFEKEMKDAKVNYEIVKYGGAVHSFTEKEAGNDNSKGAAYNAQADQRSWIALQNFLGEIF